ncbi:UDP-N-acetylmuramoyl-tripeptide--D-alanyl-D-alanine ligase [Epilithonimonas hungarica]|uniref:UDP-N-acetylmuramoyl-tripeptide--D-alanyl-D-alanine ligase n=1 Tax=Epilithonimonas hungarica TaxID=454006 RepID=A0A1G7HTE6_9FLAO|nr:UDP-N-acetylmuramoyl-tripeptide--D-alanyl-D-alanine ligase [Epilithonimonas hungarica]SDF03761.1 UDP-N-acetylmuramoyl-tripeptide--D-alanyl-D-alanine ligase [Epilithonimonas hungarica]
MNISEFYPIFLQSKNVVIDSRKVEKESIFFAFSGESYNAAEKATDAINMGASAVIVEDEKYVDPPNNIFYVPSTLTFLQHLAIFHRDQLDIPFIGLTGSNGKTTTKELISSVLAEKFNVQYTFGNLNNHIGVPLTILSVRKGHEIAVIEMGANHQKEIEYLCAIAKPNLGYITNFGKAHLEGFGGFEGVIKGKSELYDYLKQHRQTILVNENDKIQYEKTDNYSPKITFGAPGSDYFFEPIYKDHFVGINYQGTEMFSNLTGNYNYDNLSAAVTLGLHFGLDISQIKKAIENYIPSNMRSQIQKKGNKTLVLDTYNANPSSMQVSLENFKTFEGSKLIIIGDMLELGEESLKEHQSILEFAKACGFDEMITVGPNFKSVCNSDRAFENTTQLIEWLKSNPVRKENVLLKASRGIALEKIIDYI